jgi:GT2 family glycosyltransferase
MDQMDPNPVTEDAAAPPGSRRAEPLRIEHPDESLTVRKRFERPLGPGWYRLEVRYGPEGLVDCLVELLFENGRSELRRLPYGGRNEVGCIVRWPKGLVGVDLHFSGSQPPYRRGLFEVRPAGVALRFWALMRRAFRVIRQEPFDIGTRVVCFGLRLWRKDLALVPLAPVVSDGNTYERWRALFDEEPDRDRQLHEERLAKLSRAPELSVVCLLDKPEHGAAYAAMLERQIYQNWQLVLVTDVPEHAQAALGPARTGEGRITIRPSDAFDDGDRFSAGFAAATGAFVLPLPPGVELRSNALLEFALALDTAPGARMIYADEDELAAGERANPRFKPAWSPEVLATHDYMGDPVMVQTRAVRQAGGCRSGLGKDALYDLKLRLVAATGSSAVVHLAKLLAHRTARGDRDPAAAGAGRHRVIEEHLSRQGIRGRVVQDARSPRPRVEYAVPRPPPLVSIMMPTKDKASVLRRAVGTLLDVTQYRALELLVIDNGSHETETQDLFRSWADDARVRVIESAGRFNFSALNNEAARHARGDILVLLNNDVEIIDPGWLDEMVGLACRPEIGCVGAKLYYPDGTIQHAGVITGPGGGAGHGHKLVKPGATGYLDRLVTVTNVSAVTAACLAVRAEVYREVGGFDEMSFAVAFNDVDFCLKVAAAGYRNVWTPFAELIHHESVSRGKDVTPEAARRFAGEVAALQQRWSVRLLRDPYYSPHLTMEGEDYALRTR